MRNRKSKSTVVTGALEGGRGVSDEHGVETDGMQATADLDQGTGTEVLSIL